jgi:hypothetical protein
MSKTSKNGAYLVKMEPNCRCLCFYPQKGVKVTENDLFAKKCQKPKKSPQTRKNVPEGGPFQNGPFGAYNYGGFYRHTIKRCGTRDFLTTLSRQYSTEV